MNRPLRHLKLIIDIRIPVQTIVWDAPQEICNGFLILEGLFTKIGEGLEETEVSPIPNYPLWFLPIV